MIIEELPASPTGATAPPPPSPEQQATTSWLREQQRLLPGLVHLCTAYAPPTPPPDGPPGSTPVHADPGLPPPPTDLFTPWTSPAAAAACGALLDHLQARARPLPPPSRALRSSIITSTSSLGGGTAAGTSSSSSPSGAGAGGSLALLPAHVVSEQDLLLACLPYILSYDPWVCPEEDAAGGQGLGPGGGSSSNGVQGQQWAAGAGAGGAGGTGQRRGGLRGVLIQKHVQSLEEGPITPYGGPGTRLTVLR